MYLFKPCFICGDVPHKRGQHRGNVGVSRIIIKVKHHPGSAQSDEFGAIFENMGPGDDGPPELRRQWMPEEGLEVLLRRGEAELEGIEDLSAQAEIRLAWEGERHRASASVLYKRPGLFRLEVRGGPLLSRVFTAVRQGDSLVVLPRSRTPV